MQFAFNSPWYLILLALIPWVWFAGRDSLSSMGRWRARCAWMIRSLILSLIVAALAETQLQRTHDRLTVIYVLDQSESIPRAQRTAMLNFIQRDVTTHRNRGKRDRAAVIVFGREASIEVAPLEDDLPLAGRLETVYDLRPDATNLAQALKLAQATFPEDSARRIVIVSDGNENEGDARSVGEVMAQDGIGIDVVPIVLAQRAEVEVDKVALPAETRIGQPFDASVVLQNLAEPTPSDNGTVRGTLRVWLKRGRSQELINQQPVTLPPGKSVMQFRHTLDEPDFYEFEAEFVPDNPQVDDALTQNNRATAYTQVLGAASVLLIEDWEHPGHFNTLVQRLRDQDMQITIQPTSELFASLSDLQRYDCVILADVPRSSGNVDVQTNFSNEQIDILIRNTQILGCGLIMIGGENSFGAGGWSNTDLEKAMPVDFQIKDARVVPVGALAMVMHASELANGNHWQKVVSQEAINVLGPQDYCGVIHWDGREAWLWGKPDGLVRVGSSRDQMMRAVGRMTPGDMPDFDPSLALAAAAFAKLDDAAVKHMVVISDGDPNPPTPRTIGAFKRMKIQISTVAVGTHGPAGSSVLQSIADDTGGKYYVVNNPQALPRIFQKESMKVARPLVKEEKGMQPAITLRHEILQGIDAVPPIDGFVLTTRKQNSLVDVSILSPEPGSPDNGTVLASWTFGAGRTVVFTTDAGHRWATDWTGWEGYDSFFGQMIRWAMRPTGNQDNFSVATQVQEGRGKVVVTAMDKNDNILNFLQVNGDLINPQLESTPLTLKNVAPGRYEGEFDASRPGGYFLALSPGPEHPILRAGLNVPYSAEYRDRVTNHELLRSLAAMTPTGGSPGEWINVDIGQGNSTGSTIDTFRHDLPPAVSSQDVWPLLVLAAGCIFLADVFVRRVAPPVDWITSRWNIWFARRFGTQPEVVPDARLARLRSRKAELHEQLDQQHTTTNAPRFDDQNVIHPSVTDQPISLHQSPTSPAPSPPTSKGEDYTQRLLRAKKAARKDKPPD